MFVTTLALFISNVYASTEDDNENKTLYLNETLFTRLFSYQVNSTRVDEDSYAWIAKVIHSRKSFQPILCTASCIKDNLFVTAAICVYQARLEFTRVIYRGIKLHVKAFVMPLIETQQLYDDAGLIVTNNTAIKRWKYIELLRPPRTDSNFNWMYSDHYDLPEYEFLVLGYTAAKRSRSAPDIKNYGLYSLQVHIDMKFCHDVLTYHGQKIKGYHVPCYYACSYKDFIERKKNCDKYHGVEGGAVLRVYKNEVSFIGTATWGAGLFDNYTLPVGFAVTNSDTFDEMLKCGLILAQDRIVNVEKGYYKKLCNT